MTMSRPTDKLYEQEVFSGIYEAWITLQEQLSASAKKELKSYWKANLDWQRQRLEFVERQVEFLRSSKSPDAPRFLKASSIYVQQLFGAIVIAQEIEVVDREAADIVKEKIEALLRERKPWAAFSVVEDWAPVSSQIFHQGQQRLRDFERRNQPPTIEYLPDNHLYLREARYIEDFVEEDTGLKR
jgi:hypothetical protein